MRRELGKKVGSHFIIIRACIHYTMSKVIEAGGNAVLGYMSHFDVEGTSGIVARAYGTACRILKVSELSCIYMKRCASDSIRLTMYPPKAPTLPPMVRPRCRAEVG